MSAVQGTEARLLLVSGAGNRFALLDAREGGSPRDAGALARSVCGAGALRGGAADGLLVLEGARESGDLALAIWNADGSRAAACGNGLRCAAWVVFRARGANLGATLRIETDCGSRTAVLLESGGTRARVRVGMGRGERFALSAPVAWEGRELAAIGVRLGNLHCVLRVADERSAPVDALGRALQAHPDFRGGVNVGFLARRDGVWRLRVFERGVGETAACGSGACAAALAVDGGTDPGSAFEVEMRGGRLAVERDADGEIALSGEAEIEEERRWATGDDGG